MFFALGRTVTSGSCRAVSGERLPGFYKGLVGSQCLGTEVVCVGAALLVAVLCCRAAWNRTRRGSRNRRLLSGCCCVLKDLVLVIKQKAAASLLCSLPPCWFNLK